MRWGWSDLPGMYALPCVLAMPIDPGGTCASLPDGYTLLPATLKTVSASTCSTYEADTGFTLSHYGSPTSPPPLKPGLAAKAPRLCTDCLPGFVRAGVSPAYTAYTELAHLQRCPILHMSKSKIMVPIFMIGVKGFSGAIWPLGWCYFSVTVVLKVRASGALSP